MYLPREICSSIDLAALLNRTAPLTEADASEGPLQWAGIGILGGESYEIDARLSSDTRCVLRDVNAAADFKTGFHHCPMYRTMPEISRPHWCPAEYSVAEYFDGEGSVVLDWREVTLAHGAFEEVEEFATPAEAQERFREQCEWMAEYEEQCRASEY